MSRSPKNPLQPLLEEERQQLRRLSRGQALAASPVARAKAVPAVADGGNYTDAARAAGRPSGDAVAAWVGRFNVEGLAAVVPWHGANAVELTRWRTQCFYILLNFININFRIPHQWRRSWFENPCSLPLFLRLFCN